MANGWQYALHCDGTRKIHHGIWELITLGTHVMALDTEKKKKSVLSFRPLIYLFCKQQETDEALQLTVAAAHEVRYT